MDERAARVEECLKTAHSLREAIDRLSHVQDRALLIAMGLRDSESSESDTDTESDSEEAIHSPPLHTESSARVLPPFQILKEALEQGQYNWFVLVEFVEQEAPDTLVENHLKEFYSFALELPLLTQQKDLLTTSYAASLPSADQSRVAALLNGDIVSDSESNDPDDYVGLTSVALEHARAIISRKRVCLARKVWRIKAKTLASRNFLCRKVSKRAKSIVDRFPDIGQAIESYVSECNVSADAWRRTGILTFDGNLRIKQKVTYGRIQQHLEEKYQYKISYGTVVQLCIARNKH